MPHTLPEGCCLCALLVLQHLQHPSTPEAWKLQLLQLLARDWLLAPLQALSLLACFDPQLGRSEQVAAAAALHMALVAPMEGMRELVPELTPSQQHEFREL